MTGTSPPYGDQPSAPSTRVTEAELLEIESDEVDRLESGDVYAQRAARRILRYRLVAAIRRYRALLIGLAQGGPGFPSGPNEDIHCLWCSAWLGGRHEKHSADCHWPALEAEVQAIRAEREVAAKSGPKT